jgi:cyclic pyranopterin phosphate synthase
MLTDSYGRIIDYLRISVTDKCNLRCVYCMPPSGVAWKPHDSILSLEEILRITKIMAELGINKIKVTGGEPLIRKGLAYLIKNLKAVPGIEKVTMTTNGVLLDKYIDACEDRNSVPDGINLSLNALSFDIYKKIAVVDERIPGSPVSLIDRLLKMKIPVKVNCVPVKGFNDGEIIPLAALAKERDIAVRYIELMPLGPGSALSPVTGQEVMSVIENKYGPLSPAEGVFGSGPAEYYSLGGFTGKIGFINPVSCGFCEKCSRLRLTAEGLLKPCLSSSLSVDLGALMGASDGEIMDAVIKTVDMKPKNHTLSAVYGGEGEEHLDGMSVIGG